MADPAADNHPAFEIRTVAIDSSATGQDMPMQSIRCPQVDIFGFDHPAAVLDAPADYQSPSSWELASIEFKADPAQERFCADILAGILRRAGSLPASPQSPCQLAAIALEPSALADTLRGAQRLIDQPRTPSERKAAKHVLAASDARVEALAQHWVEAARAGSAAESGLDASGLRLLRSAKGRAAWPGAMEAASRFGAGGLSGAVGAGLAAAAFAAGAAAILPAVAGGAAIGAAFAFAAGAVGDKREANAAERERVARGLAREGLMLEGPQARAAEAHPLAASLLAQACLGSLAQGGAIASAVNSWTSADGASGSTAHGEAESLAGLRPAVMDALDKGADMLSSMGEERLAARLRSEWAQSMAWDLLSSDSRSALATASLAKKEPAPDEAAPSSPPKINVTRIGQDSAAPPAPPNRARQPRR